MNFTGNKAIYLQIADYICEEILAGKYADDERIPSVREVAGMVEVNSNTVMRTFDWLQSHDIIYTRRGLGYFVCNGAKDNIREERRKEFIDEVIPNLLQTMKTLGITKKELLELLRDA
ncbi:MAG: GntR family transcriptional regulator [Prevotellaceae bacterium]|nr:GntR family transcriptional regulator [Candidatus Colivivens caballi]